MERKRRGTNKWKQRKTERERREQRPSVGVNISLLPLGLRCHRRDRKVSRC